MNENKCNNNIDLVELNSLNINTDIICISVFKEFFILNNITSEAHDKIS